MLFLPADEVDCLLPPNISVRKTLHKSVIQEAGSDNNIDTSQRRVITQTFSDDDGNCICVSIAIFIHEEEHL
jgi:hypothetical protein